MYRIKCFIASLIILMSVNNEVVMAEVVKLYYTPLGVGTYTPITVQNIETSSYRYGEIEVSHPQMERLYDLLSSSENSGTISPSHIRIKISLNHNNNIYIDNYGVVSGLEAVTKQLSANEISNLIAIMENITEVKSSNWKK